MRVRIDGLGIVAIGLLLFMGLKVLQDQGLFDFDAAARQSATALGGLDSKLQASAGTTAESTPGTSPELPPGPTPATILPAGATLPTISSSDADLVASPYDHYIVTQGPHGFDYGQAAVDIAAGKGAVIKSPINGVITQLFIDEWGNTNLIIENEHYTVLMLHGIYIVHAGEAVMLGQPVGNESNQGYTLDPWGQLCSGRDCGYHTHLNIYDKRLGTNVNPLELIGQ